MSSDTVVIYADGGSRGNPGPSGCGAVIIEDGRTLCEISQFLGHATNNIAEWTGLLLALEKAREMGLRSIEVRMDSELVVKQMRGQYRVKNEKLIPLYQKARKLSLEFPAFAIVHVRREENQIADRLANMAMDAGARSL